MSTVRHLNLTHVNTLQFSQLLNEYFEHNKIDTTFVSFILSEVEKNNCKSKLELVKVLLIALDECLIFRHEKESFVDDVLRLFNLSLKEQIKLQDKFIGYTNVVSWQEAASRARARAHARI